MTTRIPTYIYAFSAILLLWVNGTRLSAQPDADDTRTTHSVRIAEQDFPLTFGDQSVTDDVKRSIAEDLQFIFSSSGSTSIVLRARRPRRVNEWHGHPVTHSLCELTSGEFTRFNSTTFPSVIRDTFGYAVTISNALHLIVHENLLATYSARLKVVDKHPTMLGDLKKYLTLLQDPTELGKVAGDQQQAEEMVYCYRVSLDTGLRLFRAYVRDLSSAYSLTFKQPSLLDIDPLGQGFKDENAPEDVYIVTVVVSGQESPDSEKFSERLPLGAYANGKWHIFAWPMP